MTVPIGATLVDAYKADKEERGFSSAWKRLTFKLGGWAVCRQWDDEQCKALGAVLRSLHRKECNPDTIISQQLGQEHCAITALLETSNLHSAIYELNRCYPLGNIISDWRYTFAAAAQARIHEEHLAQV